MSENGDKIYQGWVEALKDFKFRPLTPYEELQFNQMKANEEYCKKASFTLGEPIDHTKR